MRISGKSFDINVGNNLIHVDKATLSIEDNTQAVKTKGIPSGYVAGDVAATGELDIDALNMQLLISEAETAGGFRAIAPVDIVFFADTGDEELKVEAFDCLLKITSLLDIDANGGAKHMTKIPFEVTSTDFVRINGTPYLSNSEVRDI